MDSIQKYLNDVSGLLENAPVEQIRKVSELLVAAYKENRQVFMMGNGGSAATASHLVADLQKSIGLGREKKFKVMALTDNVAVITALGNDVAYADIFSEQLATWVNPGDLVIAISGSGNSPNVIKAIELAKAKGAVTVGMTGFSGGKLAEIAQYNIIVPSEDMQHIEDVHMTIGHLLFQQVLREATAQ